MPEIFRIPPPTNAYRSLYQHDELVGEFIPYLVKIYDDDAVDAIALNLHELVSNRNDVCAWDPYAHLFQERSHILA